jgi:hypothetical protein
MVPRGSGRWDALWAGLFVERQPGPKHIDVAVIVLYARSEALHLLWIEMVNLDRNAGAAPTRAHSGARSNLERARMCTSSAAIADRLPALRRIAPRVCTRLDASCEAADKAR